ncbi:MAG: DNA-directed RNA polymerase subunit beta [Chloroflexi bacterium]|nr:DNA-directed RNA polymerase subunit beta [Chloroflexota bacterium]
MAVSSQTSAAIVTDRSNNGIPASVVRSGAFQGLRRKAYARIPEVLEMPTLIQVQLDSFHWFQTEGLQELLDEISPITSFGGNMELSFTSYRFEEPKYTEKECRDMDLTYATPLWVKVRLNNKETGEIQEQEVFMGEFPLMTSNGTFIVNGAERVVVSQLIRSPGVYFTVEEDRATGRTFCNGKLIPNRGAWMEYETKKRDDIGVKVDRKRKIPVTVLLRALGAVEDEVQVRSKAENPEEVQAKLQRLLEAPAYSIIEGSDEELLRLFDDVDTSAEHPYIASTIERDSTKNAAEALIEFYKKMRPGDPPTMDNARDFLQGLIFSPRRYDLGKVGRYKLNKRLGQDTPLNLRTLTKQDIVNVIKRIIQVNNGIEHADDIDHLGNRRVKTVGELLQNQLRVGLLRMERVVRERMSIRDQESLSPAALINIRPVVAATREFFGGSQLSQFMEQTNPLAELTHKRTLSALGPGGLRRERAGFDVRDVHNSHYGRICPIETPEGPNIGLIGRLATYGRVNEFGFIETPYRRVIRQVANRNQDLIGKVLREDIYAPSTEGGAAESGALIASAGQKVDEALFQQINALPEQSIRIRPIATQEISYLTADEEDRYTIAQANANIDSTGMFVENRISVRRGGQFSLDPVDRIEYMDVSPKQIVGVSAALIPFLEHDDANRALMGSNMQRQGVPLIAPEAPIVGTGMEYYAAVDSGQVVVAERDGQVISATSRQILIRDENGEVTPYRLRKYNRSNQSTCIDQRPVVQKGDIVKAGQVLADSSSTENGELALGQNVLVAFLSWEGGNYEDAILISESTVRRDKFTSVHIEKHEVEARDTKLGPEEITRDIPNVGEDALKDLDEEGVVRIGAEIGPGDILVGKITPKGETDLTPEEKLLRAIFGEKAREVKDSSLRLPHGERGKVIDIKSFTREQHQDLPAGVDKIVRVSVAQQRKVTSGDKMAGRHGNKGVVSKVVPLADMPFLADGTPMDIVLNPLGVPSRMNIGQILETHLGWAADRLGMRVITPVFDGAKELEITAELARAWLIDHAWHDATEQALKWVAERQMTPDQFEDDHDVRLAYFSHWLTDSAWGNEDPGTDLRVLRRATLRQWLFDHGYDPATILVFEEDRRDNSEREVADRLARDVCLRFWLQSRGEDTTDIPPEKIASIATAFSRTHNLPLPISGKQVLYDGKTGEAYDQPVTVGIIYMMKLAHLVEDKVHARSTGPYSLVTQQPLGGKAQFGGQRFGEMEVWALEAYGAAHILQEVLTVKSDDVTGRVKTYEAIVKGEPIQEPGIPESFRVLVKELQSLALSVEVLDHKGRSVQFGRDDSDDRTPKLGWGLNLPSAKRRRAE